MYISIQYLIEAPLPAITCLESFGVWCNKICIWIGGFFVHSSLQILSSSFWLDGDHPWTAIFRSLQRCSIGFKSRLWLDHYKTFTTLSLSHSCVALAVCLGSLSCWKANLRLRLRYWALWNRIYWGCLCTLLHSAFPQPLPVSQSLPLKNTLTAWGCYQHTLLLGWYSAGDVQIWFPSNTMLRIEVQ